jgi:hypothetical protein
VEGDVTSALIWLIFPIALFTVIPWMWGGYGRGEVIVSENDIRMKTRRGTFIFPWEDITSAREFLPDEELKRDHFIYHLLGRPTYPRQAVEVQLVRSIRRSLYRDQFGTSLFGIPIGITKQRFFVSDPDSLFADISRGLEQKRRAEPDRDEPT